ncbi:MAG: hypothetical protein AAFZ18_24510 [Myxococcota bacterium]
MAGFHGWWACLLALTLLWGCGEDAAEGPVCPSDVNYATLRATVLEPFCLECHSSSRQGALRQGAPAELDFDVYDRELASRLANAVTSGAMPPPTRPRPSAEDRALVSTWRQCGFPE